MIFLRKYCHDNFFAHQMKVFEIFVLSWRVTKSYKVLPTRAHRLKAFNCGFVDPQCFVLDVNYRVMENV